MIRKKDRKYSRALVEKCKREYVSSDYGVTIDSIAEKYGVNSNYLRGISAKHEPTWSEQRHNYWAKVQESILRKASDDMADKIVIANQNHIDVGIDLQKIGTDLLTIAKKVVNDDVEKVKPGEAMRIGVSAVKVGVDIQRKGLGLADTIVHIQNMREVAEKVMTIIANHVTDPDVLKSIIHDIKRMQRTEEAKFSQEIPLSDEQIQ